MQSLTLKKITEMKYLLTLAFVALATVAFSQAKPTGPVIAWEKATYDFGDITQGDKVEHVFKFTNTGTEPVVITNVQVTCGCTLPKSWPRDPIQPGGKGEITVAFNSNGKIGKQNKVVTIVSNAVNADGGQIAFMANVLNKQPQ